MSDFKSSTVVNINAVRDFGFCGVHEPLGDVPFDNGCSLYKPTKVYVFTMVWTPFLKVGISKDAIARRSSLSSPYDIDIRHVRIFHDRGDAVAVEKIAHEILSPWQQKNEWFRTSVTRAISAINQAASIHVGEKK